MEPKSSNCTLLVLMGLPACGKTTLSKFIKDHYSKSESLQLTVLNLSYDDFVDLKTQSNSATHSKVLRNNFLKCVLHLGKSLINSTPINLSQFLERLESELSPEANELFAKDKFLDKISIHSQELSNSKASKYILVIDDNNYYRSMRTEIYQIAKELCSGFSVIYVKTPLEVCLSRNKGRGVNDKIPEQTIIDMSKKMQEPNPLENTIDTYSFIFNGAEDVSNYPGTLEVIIENSFANPVHPPRDRTAEVQRERRICQESEIHQADLMLRKWVNTELTMCSFGSKKIKTLANELNRRKTLVITGLKSGELKIRANLKENEEIEFRKEIIGLAKSRVLD